MPCVCACVPVCHSNWALGPVVAGTGAHHNYLTPLLLLIHTILIMHCTCIWQYISFDVCIAEVFHAMQTFHYTTSGTPVYFVFFLNEGAAPPSNFKSRLAFEKETNTYHNVAFLDLKHIFCSVGTREIWIYCTLSVDKPLWFINRVYLPFDCIQSINPLSASLQNNHLVQSFHWISLQFSLKFTNKTKNLNTTHLLS